MKALEEELEELKVSTEDQIQELKFQLAEANKSKSKLSAQKELEQKESEKKESHKSLKPVEVEKIVEVVKEVEKEPVPTEQAQT